MRCLSLLLIISLVLSISIQASGNIDSTSEDMALAYDMVLWDAKAEEVLSIVCSGSWR